MNKPRVLVNVGEFDRSTHLDGGDIAALSGALPWHTPFKRIVSACVRPEAVICPTLRTFDHNRKGVIYTEEIAFALRLAVSAATNEIPVNQPVLIRDERSTLVIERLSESL